MSASVAATATSLYGGSDVIMRYGCGSASKAGIRESSKEACARNSHDNQF